MAFTVGFEVLSPTNTRWLRYGDPAANLIGWEYFRRAAWTLPLGVIRGYGPDFDSSIVYSDSLPLFAIPLKLFNGLLPEQFQYFGLWILLCLILQAWFGLRIVFLKTDDIASAVFGATLFVLAPVLGWRLLPEISHFALSAHFLLLAGIYLALDRDREFRHRAWTVLLVAAVLIHAYLFVMVAAIWIADIADRLRAKQRIPLKQILIPVYLVVFTAWLVGYFVVTGDAAGWGFGVFRSSPLALLDAGSTDIAVWSRILPAVSDVWLNHEGFGYLGSGILLLSAGLVFFVRPSKWSAPLSRHAALVGVTLLASMFAVSNQVGTDRVWFSYPLPDLVFDVASIFRASGRMIWLLAYLIAVVVVLSVAGLDRRGSARALLALAVLVQVADSSSAVAVQRDYGQRVAMSDRVRVLVGPFWDVAGDRYRHVRHIEPTQYSVGWQRISEWALQHNMTTSMVYVSRLSTKVWLQSSAEFARRIRSGNYEADTLYVIDDTRLDDVLATLRPDDAVIRKDGFNLLAPGWNRCDACLAVEGLRLLRQPS